MKRLISVSRPPLLERAALFLSQYMPSFLGWADHWRKWIWWLPLSLVVLLVLLPLISLTVSWLQPQTAVWQHLWQTQLPRLLSNSAQLLIGVGFGVTVLGVSLGWLVANCDFPGKKWLQWALILPLAIPAYVLAFVMMGWFDYSAPLSIWWRETLSTLVAMPDIRSAGGVSLVLSLVLYPYVYLLARGAFLAQSAALNEAAHLSGVGAWRCFFSVSLPIARPAIVAGVSLVLMEVLADFGTVAIFNFDTFTTAIYKSWFGLFNMAAAAQLATLLLLIVFLALLAEQRWRRPFRLPANTRQNTPIYRLTGYRAWSATALTVFVLGLAFAMPLLQLIQWAGVYWADIDARFLQLVWKTAILGAISALVVTALAILIALSSKVIKKSHRRNRALVRWFERGIRVSTLGYALPGSVLAVGIVMAFSKVDRWLVGNSWLVGSLAALLIAYLIRFFTVGLRPIQSGFDRIPPHYNEAAQSLSANRHRILRRIYLPLLTPSLFSAVLLVWVDTMKEMPATLLMRPFGWDTLAVRIYEMTSEGEWERAALPALVLIGVSLIPVGLLIHRSRHS